MPNIKLMKPVPILDCLFAIKNLNHNGNRIFIEEYINKDIVSELLLMQNNYKLIDIIKVTFGKKFNIKVVDNVKLESAINKIETLLSTAFTEHFFKRRIHIENYEVIKEYSCFQNPYFIRDLYTQEDHVYIIPSLFMKTAPAEKYGFSFVDKEGRKHIVLLFKLDNKLFQKESKFFIQWFRAGVWHFSVKDYLNNVKKKITYKVQHSLDNESYFDSNLEIHRDYITYVLSNILEAVKIISEYQLNENELISNYLREPYSKGLYHIEWFVKYLLPKKLNDEVILNAIKTFTSRVFGNFLTKTPIFYGPLQACNYRFWNNNVKLFFSPSVNKYIKVKIERNINRFLNIKTVLENDIINPLGDSCNVIFTLKDDIMWLNKISQMRPILMSKMFINSSFFIIVFRNTLHSSFWTKIVVTSNESEFIRVNNKFGNAPTDWICEIDGELELGEVEYLCDGTIQLTENKLTTRSKTELDFEL